MSSEDSANYSDAQSGYSLSGDATPALSSSSGNDAPQRRKETATTGNGNGASIFLRSESSFLVLLFASIVLLLPAFFFFASSTAPETGPDDSAETRTFPLSALVPYIPAVSTLFRLSFSAFYTLLRPLIAVLSVILALLAPVSIAATVVFKVLIILPARMVTGAVQYFYPVYVFCGTACILGGVVGLGGKLLVEGSRLMLARTHDETGVRKGEKRRVKNSRFVRRF